MRFVVRRVFAAIVLIAIVPSLTYIYFAALYSDEPILPGLRDYLEAVFLRLELDGALGGGARTDVYYLLHEGVPLDIALICGSLVIGVGLGSLGGLYLAARNSRATASLLSIGGAVAICAPAAVTAYVFLFVLGFDSVRDGLWIAWLAVGLPIAGAVMRVSAGASRDALSEDSVRTAHAKGVRPGRVLRRHVFVFAVPPVSAFAGATVNLVILNSAIVQQIFNLPGSFRYARQAIENPDVGLLQTTALITVIYVVAGNLIADLVAMWADPRSRTTAGRRGVLRRPA